MPRPFYLRSVGIVMLVSGLLLARPDFAQAQVRAGEPEVAEKAGKDSYAAADKCRDNEDAGQQFGRG